MMGGATVAQRASQSGCEEKPRLFKRRCRKLTVYRRELSAIGDHSRDDAKAGQSIESDSIQLDFVE